MFDIEREPGAGATLVRQAQQRINVVVLAHETQFCPFTGAKVAHGLGQATREVLDT